MLNSLAVIKDWSVSAPHSHLAGGMTYHDGKLTVPTPGRYYIYAQMYYKNNGRTVIRVNNNVVSMIQPPKAAAKTDEGALHTGVVLNLKAGDVITLFVSSWPVNSAKVYMYSVHSFFGAFLIWAWHVRRVRHILRDYADKWDTFCSQGVT